MRHLLSIFCLLCLSFQLRALILDGYDAPKNDRFTNDGSFIAAGFDLSGIAISADGRWVTMISPNVFATAWHFTPGSGQSVTFYKTNDPSGPSVTRTVTSTRSQIGSSDLRLCVLDQPLPEGYTFYSRATASLPTGLTWNRYPYKDEELYHLGRPPGKSPPDPNQAVGKNVLDRRVIGQIASDGTTGPAIECTYDSGSGSVAYETFGIGGDSGAPIFFDEGDGTLTLVGIAWYQTNLNGNPFATGFSPVGDYDAAIDDFLNTHSLPYFPASPGSFSGSRISDSRIDLSWQDLSEVETAYRLERAEAATGPWVLVNTLPADSSSYSDTSAPSGDVYYRLRAENATAGDYVETAILTPYSLWATGFNWNGEDQSPTGDANQDGLSNLAAYSMSLSPIDPVPPEALPYLEVANGNIDYYYRRNPDASDISYTLTRSGTLIVPDWQPVTVDGVNVTESIQGSVEDADLIRIRMPEDSELRNFFRLEFRSSELP